MREPEKSGDQHLLQYNTTSGQILEITYGVEILSTWRAISCSINAEERITLSVVDITFVATIHTFTARLIAFSAVLSS